jgi:AcrR family transcriptional regulator
MAIIVEHEKRKREILERALDVFVAEGYEDATFQKISDRCGITRTTLYIYFKNKREIFMFSIKQLTEGLEQSLLEIMNNPEYSSSEILRNVAITILEKCVSNRKLFNVLLSYLLQLQKTGKNPGERVRRRTIRLRHLLSKIIIDGINKGEFKDVNVKACNEMFYSLIESTVFRLAILDSENVEELFPSIELAIEGLKK